MTVHHRVFITGFLIAPLFYRKNTSHGPESQADSQNYSPTATFGDDWGILARRDNDRFPIDTMTALVTIPHGSQLSIESSSPPLATCAGSKHSSRLARLPNTFVLLMHPGHAPNIYFSTHAS
ncbi:hypothetical protein CRG98_030413 [Punica granatum]|uniref:Uncharacterized protein n=1 Tax=Punica granatum TaxID=22663 RepID=A0A2I0IYY7_PUNGR|nr:hypothetical protein CRG98_030413 [Punica granatum]